MIVKKRINIVNMIHVVDMINVVDMVINIIDMIMNIINMMVHMMINDWRIAMSFVLLQFDNAPVQYMLEE